MIRTLAAGLGAVVIAAAIGWVALAFAQSPSQPAPVVVALPKVADPPLPQPVLPGQPGAIVAQPAKPILTPIMPPNPGMVVQTAAQSLVGPELDAPLILPTTTITAGHSEKPSRPSAPNVSRAPTRRQETSVILEWIGPDAPQASQATDYTLVVRNTGQSAVQQVQARIRLTGDVAILASEPKGTPEGGSLCWDVGTLLPQQERHVQLRLSTPARGEFAADAWVTFSNSASLRASVREPTLAVNGTAPSRNRPRE